MQSIEAVKSGFKRASDFSGTSTRAEFWGFALFIIAGGAIAHFLDLIILGASATTLGPITFIFAFAMAIPFFAVGARRLHAMGQTGWWQIIPFNLIMIAKLLSNNMRIEDTDGWTNWIFPGLLMVMALAGVCLQLLVITWYSQQSDQDKMVQSASGVTPEKLDSGLQNTIPNGPAYPQPPQAEAAA